MGVGKTGLNGAGRKMDLAQEGSGFHVSCTHQILTHFLGLISLHRSVRICTNDTMSRPYSVLSTSYQQSISAVNIAALAVAGCWGCGEHVWSPAIYAGNVVTCTVTIVPAAWDFHQPSSISRSFA